MKRLIVGAVVALSLVLTGSAAASGLSGETITTTLLIPAFPATPPYTAQYDGTFTASGPIADTGTVSAATHLSAVPSPTVGVLHTTRTLTGAQGTLVLRCEQIAKDFSNPSDVPNTGTCAILSGTGAYAGAHGSGKIAGMVDFTASPKTLTDVLTF